MTNPDEIIQKGLPLVYIDQLDARHDLGEADLRADGNLNVSLNEVGAIMFSSNEASQLYSTKVVNNEVQVTPVPAVPADA